MTSKTFQKLTTKNDELNAVAKRQLNAKLKLEPRLRREMSVLFATISREMRALYSAKGAILDAKEFQPEVEQILKQHYRRVSRIFGISLRQQLAKHFKPDEMKTVDDDVDNNMKEFINTTTALRASLIIETTQRDINGGIEFALAVAADDDGVTRLENAVIADMGSKEFNRRSKPRTETIAVTETQTAAEGSKEVEAQTVATTAGRIANVPPSQVILKEWVAVLDERTRDAHVLADGQRVGVDDVFVVMGERLRFPGDTSQGASAENVINCRCISAVVVNNEPIASAIDSRVNPQTGFRNAPAQGVIGA
jgi:hypothetical protein